MRRILIVENDRFAQALLRDLLNYLGYDHVCTEHGAEALAVLECTQTIHLVITDLHMPVMDGLALLEALQGHPVWHTIPAILVSGRLTEDLVQRAFKAGAKKVIPKPYDFRTLAGAIAQVLAEASPDEGMR
ncbi:MAG: response regulator [Nitrospirae bacterium]|nr:MAG: response regulator [Nitrospirota bacterium]